MILPGTPDADLPNGNPLAGPLQAESGEARKLRTLNLKHGVMDDPDAGSVRVAVIDEATR